MNAVVAPIVVKDRRLSPGQVPPTVVETLEAPEREKLVAKIKRLLSMSPPGARPVPSADVLR